jgi:hypothetical protein
MGKDFGDDMKLEFIGISEIFKDSDEVILAKLLAAHQAVRDITESMKKDVEIQKLQRQLDKLKEPYRVKILRNRSIIQAAEIVARSRGLIKVQEEEN